MAWRSCWYSQIVEVTNPIQSYIYLSEVHGAWRKPTMSILHSMPAGCSANAPPQTEAGGQEPKGLPPVRVSQEGLHPRLWWKESLNRLEKSWKISPDHDPKPIPCLEGECLVMKLANSEVPEKIHVGHPAHPTSILGGVLSGYPQSSSFLDGDFPVSCV